MENLNDLAYFVQVAEHGGFAAAERATGIPKSKLSRRIAELESRLGVRLIQRSTRRFAVTDIGERTLMHARAMLAEAEAALALSAEESAMPRGTVRLSCPPALLQYAVADMVAKFLLTWPQIEVHVESTNRNVDLWHDGMDVTLRVRFPASDGVLHSTHSDEIVKSLARSSHVLVASPQMLNSIVPPSSPTDLGRLPTLGLGNSTEESSWTLIGPENQRVVVQHQPRLMVNDVGALMRAALAGVGCASLPHKLVDPELADGRFVEVLPGWAPPAGTIQAAFASRRGMRPAVRQLLDFFTREFEQLVVEGKYLSVA